MLLNGTEDLRVQKTIEAIHKTFEEMICEMDYEKITVKEQVGVCRNLEGKETATGSFIIHYSKSGVHIVPKEEMK